jgi:signal transduction histidine kinase
MSNTLQVLLLIYSAVLIINLVVSAVLFKLYSHYLFKILIAMWGFSLVNFFMQGIFISPGIGMYFSFSTYTFVSLSLHYFSNFILKKKSISFSILGLSLGLSLLGGVFCSLTNNFVLASWFASFSIAIPLLLSSYQLGKSQNGAGVKALSFLLFINAIHFLDYPILRLHPTGAVFGFSIALVLLFAFSTFFPGFILYQISRDYSVGLEREVKLRTRELEEAVDQNKTLVNILCHDLSSPLTVLDFYFEEIMQEKPSLVHIEYGTKAQRSLQTLFNVVAKVKDLQEIAYGKKTLQLHKVNVEEILQEMIRDYESQLKEKKLSVSLMNHCDGEMIIDGDKVILKNQVFSNLFSNAIKFSYPGSTIRLNLSKEKESVFVTVEDRGMGIPQELIGRLFKWSEKTNRAGTNNEKGTGFGLPLAKTCVEMMKGSIRVESVYEKTPHSDTGTKFIVQFDKAS